MALAAGTAHQHPGYGRRADDGGLDEDSRRPTRAACVYDLRITAELWETHFIDHVALLVVDHPAQTDIYVDERFAMPPPALAVYLTTPPRPVARAWDEQGREVTDMVRVRDGRYLDTFGRGTYQV